MAKKQINQAIEKLLRSATQLNQKFTSQERFWLMRSGFVGRQAQPEGGFILPTVTLLLVMLSLVLGILIFRTGNRTNQIIGERQQRQIYNATTPAVERAKAKLEFLFTEDTIPALPSENDIVTALSVDSNYTLPDETRVNLNPNDPNDAGLDNAWTFWFDADGNPATSAPGETDGNEVQVAYSLLSYASSPGGGAISLQEPDEDKAGALVVRNGPINLSGGAGNPNCPNPGLAPFQGWQQVTGSALRKSIQVHAFARNANTGVVSTLEMQQDKQANLGNKWGAWFRNDMEIFPGPAFRWNGAMNVAGSYVVGGNQVEFYPISSPSSCVYTPDNSEIVMGDIPVAVIDQFGDIDGNNQTGVGGNDLNGGNPFRGQFVIGTLRDNNFNGSSRLFPHSTDVGVAPASTVMNRNNDSVVDATVAAPGDVALDPVILLTQAQNRTRTDSDNLTPDVQEPAWNKDGTVALNWWVEDERLHNEYQPTPFVDDTYRADDRWGPKPLYSEQPYVPAPADGSLNVADPTTNEITVATAPGNNIAEQQSSFERLTRDSPPTSNTTDEESYGLDGYWERRAKAQGVRIIVGQRLELGNANGWATEFDANGNNTLDPEEDLNNNGLFDFDPLYPPPLNAADVQSASVDVDGAGGAPAIQILDQDGNPFDNSTNANGSMEGRQHEMRQWRTLRDNAAAAQSSALYHYLMSSGDYPVACIASATHPGTEQTIQASTTFNAFPGGNNPNVSFLTGEGTNGWEFYPPEYSAAGAVSHGNLINAQAAFIGEINSGNSDLRAALDNLGYFAGDPAGAFPAFQDTIGGGNGDDAANLAAFREADQLDATIGPVVHPYPIQSMWGDFSNLRRVMDKLNGRAAYGNTAYADLSLADQTTLQTASCTLGILAYNVDNVLNHPDADDDFLGDRSLFNAFRQMNSRSPVVFQKGPGPNGDDTELEVEYDAANAGPEYKAVLAEQDKLFDYNNPAASVPPEVFVAAIEQFLTPDQFETLVATRNRMQIQRDRSLGFSQGMDYVVKFGNSRILGQKLPAAGETIRLQCDFVDNNYFGKGEPTDPDSEFEFLTIALTLCPSAPKYPSLAYIFPDRDHAHDGVTANTNDLEPEQLAARQQPQSEPYTSSTLQVNGGDFSNAYTFNRGPTANTGNGSSWNSTDDIYKVVGDNDNDGILEAGEDDLDNIALIPKDVGDWAQPTVTAPAGRINAITDNTAGTTGWNPNVFPAFLDKGIFNGREAMVVRITDIDIDLLRRTEITGINNLGGTDNTDWWLPLPEILDPGEAPTRTGAAIYAFREDAVREDAIARPTSLNLAKSNVGRDTWLGVWRNYVNGAIDDNYLMNAVGVNGFTNNDFIQDPPVNPINGISPKPVDFYADPDRRPNGFRLRNGSDLRRIGADATDARGMSFVSDNPLYVQGDFNVHSTDGTRNNLIQEFTQLLSNNWDNFFTRTDLNEDFAQAGGDSWRASEIVGDGISLLSDEFSDTSGADDFHDGWISQAILNSNGNGELTTFRTINRPDTSDLSWVREDGTVQLAGNTGNSANYGVPIKISQRGFPVYCSDASLTNRADSGALNGLATGQSCAALGGEEREFGLRSNNGDRGYRQFNEGKNRIDAPANTYMNMLMVSGTNPSRANQSNGGLHNFPRFIESFGGDNLWIAGSIYQLAFSTSATGPFDQDSWEPGQLGQGPENIQYYAPPNRRWGYDTALQLVQPAPIAQRFASPSNIRSEFYRELDVDDPYIVNLRCAPDSNDPTESLDPTATCP